MVSLILCIYFVVFTKIKHYVTISLIVIYHTNLGMDRWSFEACSELGAIELVTDSVLAQNTHKIKFIS